MRTGIAFFYGDWIVSFTIHYTREPKEKGLYAGIGIASIDRLLPGNCVGNCSFANITTRPSVVDVLFDKRRYDKRPTSPVFHSTTTPITIRSSISSFAIPY